MVTMPGFRLFPYRISSSDLTLYCEGSSNRYTVSFVTNGGIALESASVAYGSPITLANATKAGDTFAGQQKAAIAAFCGGGYSCGAAAVVTGAQRRGRRSTLTVSPSGRE